LLPFTDELIVTLENSLKNSTPLPAKLMKIFNSRLSSKVQNSANTDGGKAWYAVTKDVMNAVNNENAVEDFQPMVIQSLGYNFIQLYTNVKGNKLVTEAFWPAKISGQVKLKTKASASNPTKGKISVEISPDGRDEEPDVGSTQGSIGASTVVVASLGAASTHGSGTQQWATDLLRPPDASVMPSFNLLSGRTVRRQLQYRNGTIWQKAQP
jgi:hypothetical protein